LGFWRERERERERKTWKLDLVGRRAFSFFGEVVDEWSWAGENLPFMFEMIYQTISWRDGLS